MMLIDRIDTIKQFNTTIKYGSRHLDNPLIAKRVALYIKAADKLEDMEQEDFILAFARYYETWETWIEFLSGDKWPNA